MSTFDLDKRTNVKPNAGKILIAEPFLTDLNFLRSVVFLCSHNDEGSVGFIINKVINKNISDILPDIYKSTLQLYYGGPAQNESIHIIHKYPEELGGIEVAPGIFWGSSYDNLLRCIHNNDFSPEGIKLFLGNSAWEKGKLDSEISSRVWLVANDFDDILFDNNSEKIWERSILSLGKDFSHFSQMPLHPQLN